MQPQLIAGRYQVLRAIGRGGMGIVWLCRDEMLGREVAVKQIGALPGESATETKRAMREARSAAALNHPNAVAVYDVVNHDGRPWLVMEYVEGQTLADEISRDGQLSPQRVADVGAQLASALARAHERRIVHRDIKPGNVLIDKAGRPKISDFGIARGHGDDQLTQTGFVTGTPGYLSPELARGGDPDSASDVWALGATLYAAVEGRAPYEPRSNPIALLRAIATERPRPMAQAGALRHAIETMMHEDPARRWGMATSAQRLGRIAGGGVTAVMPRVHPAATQALPVPPRESTQRLESTPSLESTQRPDPTQLESTQSMGSTQRPDSTQLESTQLESTQRMGAEAPPAAAAAAAHRAERTRSAERTQRAERPERMGATGPPQVPGNARASQPGGRRSGRRSGPRWQLPALVALLLATFGVVYLLSPLGDQGDLIAVPGATGSTTASAKATSTAPVNTAAPSADSTAGSVPSATISVPSATISVPSAASPSPSASSVPSKTSPSGRTPSSSATPVPDAGTAQQLQSFVASYYSSVTGDRDRTWNQLTPGMQAAAGGRSGYDAFWGTIDNVRVNQTRVDASARTAVVNLTYTKDSGATSTETHRFSFVKNGGGFLIESQQNAG